MYVLAINTSPHTSSCLLRDGEVIWYIEEERLSRIKNHGYEKVDRILGTGCKYYALDKVKEFTNYVDYVIFASFGRGEDDNVIIQSHLNQFESAGLDVGEVKFFPQNHHVYHAASGFYQSGFEESACLILDGGGTVVGEIDEKPIREVESIYHFEYPCNISTKFKNFSTGGSYPGLFERNGNTYYTDSLSCGKLFSQFCVNFGFSCGLEAGKVMGISSYGDDQNSDPWFTEVDDIWVTNDNVPDEKIDLNLDFKKAANYALKLQKETFNHTVRLIQRSLNLTGSKNLILSGGYALNCVNNFKYLKEFPDINFYIDPISHDGGTAYGAVKMFWYSITDSKEKFPMKLPYLGYDK